MKIINHKFIFIGALLVMSFSVSAQNKVDSNLIFEKTFNVKYTYLDSMFSQNELNNIKPNDISANIYILDPIENIFYFYSMPLDSIICFNLNNRKVNKIYFPKDESEFVEIFYLEGRIHFLKYKPRFQISESDSIEYTLDFIIDKHTIQLEKKYNFSFDEDYFFTQYVARRNNSSLYFFNTLVPRIKLFTNQNYSRINKLYIPTTNIRHGFIEYNFDNEFTKTIYYKNDEKICDNNIFLYAFRPFIINKDTMIYYFYRAKPEMQYFKVIAINLDKCVIEADYKYRNDIFNYLFIHVFSNTVYGYDFDKKIIYSLELP